MAQWMEDEVFMAYTTYSLIVIVKMMLMSLMTAYFRFTRGVSIELQNMSNKISAVFHHFEIILYVHW